MFCFFHKKRLNYIMNNVLRNYGWKPDLPDVRDLMFERSRTLITKVLPVSIDLRSQCPPVYDQGSLGSCTANAGFSNLVFKGKPVIYGNYISSGLLFGLNMNYIHFSVDSMTDLITTDFMSPVNQTVRVAYILWRGQLWTDNRRRHFKLSSIT